MRKLHAIFVRFLAGLFCLLLGACFDIHEEVWIHRNGSGRAELNYSVPESALRLTGGAAGLEAKIRELVATQPKIRLDDLSITIADEQAKISAHLSTDSLLALRDLKKSEGFQNMSDAATNIAGHFDVRVKGLDVDFARTVKIGEALGLGSLVIGGEERKNRRITYIVHLPTVPEENNAMWVEDDGKTLRWDMSLGEAMSKPVVTRFRAAMPIPWVVYAILAGLVAGGVALILRIRFLRRRRAADACMVDL